MPGPFSFKHLIETLADPVPKPSKKKRAKRAPVADARFISVEEAADIAGVKVGSFRKLVTKGVMPQPVHLPGIRRILFDILAVVAACAKLAGSTDPAAQPNPWDQMEFK